MTDERKTLELPKTSKKPRRGKRPDAANDMHTKWLRKFIQSGELVAMMDSTDDQVDIIRILDMDRFFILIESTDDDRKLTGREFLINKAHIVAISPLPSHSQEAANDNSHSEDEGAQA